MGLFKYLSKSRDAPKNLLPGSNYTFSMGRSLSGKNVDPKSAMQMSAVYACVRVLSEAIAELPLHLYKYVDDENRIKAFDHPLYDLLHDEPNDEMTSFVYRETMMEHLLLWGNSYSQIIRNGKGKVIGIYPLMPDRMTVSRDENGFIYYQYIQQTGDPKSIKKSIINLSPYEVLHIPGLGFDGLVGYSPIAMSRNAIGLGIAAEEYGSKLYANGARPSGVIEHPGTLKEATAKKLRDSWENNYGGSNNAGKTAILEEGMKYSPISISPQDAQYLENRKFQVIEIARIFRVPPHMIADLDRSTYSNIEQQSLEFVKHTLEPWCIRIEQSLKRALLTKEEKKRYYFHFNLDGLLRGDYKSRMNGYAMARQNGWMSANDIRSLENLDLIPAELGGDDYLVNGNMMPLTMAGTAYANSIKALEEIKDDGMSIDLTGKEDDDE